MDRQNAATEIDQFKRLDFATLAAGLGYERDGKESSGASTVLRSGDGDKVIIKLDGDRWVYFSVHDRTDNGSIIDFVQRRMGGTLGEVRKWLREATGHSRTRPDILSPTAPNPGQSLPPNVAIDLDGYRKKSLAVWNAATWNPAPGYLLSRGLDRGTLADPRFADTFRQDKRGNVIFPHRDRQGLCGYELRNVGFKGFGKDVKKGLWITANLKTSSTIVIVESPIDALSHCQLYQWPVSYVALGGAIGSRQRDLLTGLFVKAGARNAVAIVGTDNDPAGDQFFDELSLLAPMRLQRLKPISKDWNQDLMEAAQWN